MMRVAETRLGKAPRTEISNDSAAEGERNSEGKSKESGSWNSSIDDNLGRDPDTVSAAPDRIAWNNDQLQTSKKGSDGLTIEASDTIQPVSFSRAGNI